MVAQVKHFMKIVLAVLILAVSINMFLGPHHIAAGGVSGIGILAETALGIGRSWVVLSLNILVLVLAAIFLGKTVFLNTVVGSIVFPLFLRIVPEVMLTSDRLLSVIFGSLIFAVGVSILYTIQASSGGTTIPPLIFEKYFNLNTSVGLFVTDFMIVSMSLYVFGFEEFLFAILSIGITSIVMTYIETGMKRRKAIMIISQTKAAVLRASLMENVNRGLTILDIRGGRQEQAREMLLIVVSNQEYPEVKRIVDEIDPKSFMMTYNVAEVHGAGFTYHPIQ
ncbi:YitT family protein [Enterococcus thailandicus]|uniref:YitT family protein n=1 Tax=Enterococcus thailandicus TaxID=417368 RepID=UPI0022EBBC12|nr:YitT family protein [Enterococcus thailandicus]MDA3973925.1 YitT family protein [Enterococcus thailandicus]MDA3976264.1 YitT family protein [Enterococcus thailandicus]MDA3981229.1 YitT family protein [Enterococcus thailandicus]